MCFAHTVGYTLSMRSWLIGATLIGTQAIVLVLMGQPLICECGYVKLWEGVVLSDGNSQHLADWYTPSHVIHGLLFYALLWLAFPRIALSTRVVFAIGLEAGWEILENTPWIIDRYREQALAQGYMGDSVLNSISDTFAMIGGFLLAWRSPLILSVIVVVVLELFVGAMIRDNLTFNVMQLIYPLEAISEWQSQ